jgi:hypothetical protein
MDGIWWALVSFAIAVFSAGGMIFTHQYIRIFEGWKFDDPDAGPSEDLLAVRTTQFIIGAIGGVLFGIMALVW